MKTPLAASAALPASERPPSPATISTVVIATFLIVNAIGISLFKSYAGALAGWPRMAALATLGYGLYLAAPLVVAAALRGPRRMFGALGLDGSIREALALAIGCSAIVVATYAAQSTLVPLDRLPIDLMRTAVLPGIAEEILFRAFLFGFLFRYARWGFLPAALLSALVFGLEHLYQAQNLGEALGIALLTGAGGVWLSWLYVEWRWNLWVPIAFHVLLNAYWTAFDVADDALGGANTVVVRLACVVLSIGVTIVVARRRDGLAVRGPRWWRGVSSRPSSTT